MTKFGFLRTALAVGVAIPILAGTGAFAQQPTPTDQGPIQQGDAGAIGAASAQSEPAGIGMGSTAETERIIVTGSNIPTAQEVGPNPVLNINRDPRLGIFDGDKLTGVVSLTTSDARITRVDIHSRAGKATRLT